MQQVETSKENAIVEKIAKQSCVEERNGHGVSGHQALPGSRIIWGKSPDRKVGDQEKEQGTGQRTADHIRCLHLVVHACTQQDDQCKTQVYRNHHIVETQEKIADEEGSHGYGKGEPSFSEVRTTKKRNGSNWREVRIMRNEPHQGGKNNDEGNYQYFWCNCFPVHVCKLLKIDMAVISATKVMIICI